MLIIYSEHEKSSGISSELFSDPSETKYDQSIAKSFTVGSRPIYTLIKSKKIKEDRNFACACV
jgi:hypothetical protein